MIFEYFGKTQNILAGDTRRDPQLGIFFRFHLFVMFKIKDSLEASCLFCVQSQSCFFERPDQPGAMILRSEEIWLNFNESQTKLHSRTHAGLDVLEKFGISAREHTVNQLFILLLKLRAIHLLVSLTDLLCQVAEDSCKICIGLLIWRI